jgi:hypothetical protein
MIVAALTGLTLAKQIAVISTKPLNALRLVNVVFILSTLFQPKIIWAVSEAAPSAALFLTLAAKVSGPCLGLIEVRLGMSSYL